MSSDGSPLCVHSTLEPSEDELESSMLSDPSIRAIPAIPIVRRDDRFYLSLITFQVENCLFRVPRDAFEEQSGVFRGMFAVPTVGQEGDSDDNPIHLEGIKEAAFRNFLEVLYTPDHLERHDQLEVEQWSTVLELAHMWEFEKIQGLAITKLQSFSIDEISKVEMAQKYNIEEWYAPAYLALARRAQPLTVEETTRIGYDAAVKMAQIRERNIQRTLSRTRSAYEEANFALSKAKRASEQMKSALYSSGGKKWRAHLNEFFGSSTSFNWTAPNPIRLSFPEDQLGEDIRAIFELTEHICQ
ncbi:hypothetical protein DFH11DRAFT_551963 [Phellopilus nigrolimitatus]|nr:hypothetical protein DFH11DRAFT_551963 [Phellopilus nigrolimitatus]